MKFVEDRPGHDFKYSITSDKLNTLGFEMENNFEENLKETFMHIEVKE